jgi:hypothetical protein
LRLEERPIVISKTDYWYFTDRAIAGMSTIVRDLGDELANTRPDLPGSNSPYALLTHCVGVIDTWVGGFIVGRPITRDRDAEFLATGPITDLLSRVESVASQFQNDLLRADTAAPLTIVPPREFEGPDREMNCGAAFQHVYEELAQHHGQMELMRDVILAVRTGSLQVSTS